MKSDFDQILREKMQELSSAPPASLWSKIENALPKSNTVNKFDQAVQSKVSKVEMLPPEKIWYKIRSSIGLIKVPFYNTKAFRFLAAASVVLVSLLGWNYYTNNYNSMLLMKNSEVISKNHSHNSIIVNLKNNFPKQIIIKPKNITNIALKVSLANKSIQKTQDDIKQEIKNFSNPEINQIPQINISKSLATNLTEKSELSIYQGNDFNKFEIETNPEQVVLTENTKEKLPKESTIAAEENNKTKIAKNQKIEISVNKNLESIINILDPNLNKNLDSSMVSNNESNENNLNTGEIPKNPRNIDKFDIGLSYSSSFVKSDINNFNIQDVDFTMGYQNLNFIARAGIGASFSSEKELYLMDYKRHQFIKSQFITESLSYIYDSISHSFALVATGHQESVYDSVNYSYSAEATTNYTYIDIPFSVGYQSDFKYFSLFAKCGFDYSIIISRKVNGLYNVDNQSNITNLYYPIKTRINTNISYLLSLRTSIKLTENFSATAEVISNFYQNPIFIESKKRPNSYGIRFGITYSL